MIQILYILLIHVFTSESWRPFAIFARVLSATQHLFSLLRFLRSFAAIPPLSISYNS